MGAVGMIPPIPKRLILIAGWARSKHVSRLKTPLLYAIIARLRFPYF